MTMDAEKLIASLQAASVPFLTPESSTFESARKNFNSRSDLQYRPAVIAQPHTDDHVSAAVKAAADLGINVAIRSGGHSTIAASLGGKHGAFVVDMKAFDKISVDKEQHTAIVESGVLLGPLYLKLDEVGETCAAGTCPHVAAGGIFPAGFGIALRLHGLSVDSIQAVDIVKADGSIVYASETESKDLFWAVAGNAPSYGIVLRYYIKTWTPPLRTQQFTLLFNTTAAGATAAWLALQRWTRSADAIPEFGIVTFATMRSKTPLEKGRMQWMLKGTCLAEKDVFDRHWSLLRRQLPEPFAEIIKPDLPWIQVVDDNKVGVPPDQNLDMRGFDVRWPHAESGALLQDDLSEDALREICDFTANYDWSNTPSEQQPMLFFDVVGASGSALNKRNPAKSTIPQRERITYRIWILFFYLPSDEPENSPEDFKAEHFQYLDDLFGIVQKHLKGSDWSAYANNPDAGLKDWGMRCFGESLPRLVELKRRFDPQNVFRTPYTVPV